MQKSRKRKEDQCQWLEVTAHPQWPNENMLCAGFIFYSFHYHYPQNLHSCVFRQTHAPDSLHEHVGEGAVRDITSKTSLSWTVRSEKDSVPLGQALLSVLLPWETLKKRRLWMGFEIRRPGFRPWLPQDLHHLDTGQAGSSSMGLLQVLTHSPLTTTQWRGCTLIPLNKWGDRGMWPVSGKPVF